MQTKAQRRIQALGAVALTRRYPEIILEGVKDILGVVHEAFASAVLIAAATRGEPLEIDAPVDRLWFERVPGIVGQADEWWQLPGTRVIGAEIIDVPRAGPGVTAQCFTSGVDSFYALLNAEFPPKVLVFAHGLDMKLKDQARLDAFLPGFRETATAFGAKAVLITTNLRAHRVSRGVDLTKSHGGALAALGHVLTHEVDRIVIPSGFPYHDGKPWGSHWDLDPLWSSRRLTVEHADATFRRANKVRAIADQNLVRRYLRVCASRKTPAGNCSECEKCVRTMIALAICGQLDTCETLDSTVPLEQRVKRLPILNAELIFHYEELVRDINEPRLNAAVTRLISDSRSRPKWLYRCLRHWRDEPRLNVAVTRLISDSRLMPKWLYKRLRHWRHAVPNRLRQLWSGQA